MSFLVEKNVPVRMHYGVNLETTGATDRFRLKKGVVLTEADLVTCPKHLPMGGHF